MNNANLSCNSKKDKCVFMAITSDLMFAAANVIIGIEHHSPGLIDQYLIYYISEDPISDNDKKAILKITNKVDFREFNTNHINEKQKAFCEQFTKLALCKYEIFDLIREFRKVLWLDADILIQNDISAVFENKELAWRPTVVPFSVKYQNSNYALTEKNTAPNGGVIYVTDEILKYDITVAECYVYAEEIVMHTKNISIDEMVFGIIAFKYDINVGILPAIYNCGCGWKESQEAAILHSIGKKKFWNNSLYSILFYQWQENNKKWLNAGGSAYQGKVANSEFGSNAMTLLKAFENSEYWKSIVINYTPCNKIVKSENMYKHFFQFYIPYITNKIHYELLKKPKELIVALHIEDKKYISDKLSNELKNLCSNNEYEFISNGLLALQKKTTKEECCKEMDKLIDLTYNIVCTNFFIVENELKKN